MFGALTKYGANGVAEWLITHIFELSKPLFATMKLKRQPVALKNFAQLADDTLVLFSRGVVTALTDNHDFIAPVVSLATLTDLIDAFQAAIPDKSLRNSQNAAVKNALRVPLVEALTANCNYVNGVANGDRAKLLTSGYNISAETHPRPMVVVPTNVRVQQGVNSGSVVMGCARQQAARAYEARCKNDAGDWTGGFINTRSRQVTIDGLMPGISYQFQMRAVGADAASGWSDTLEMIVT